MLTKEAFQLYKKHLSSDGLLLLHISNQYLELAPVINGWTQDSKENKRSFDSLYKKGKSSHWALVIGKQNPITEKLKANNWQSIKQSIAWTDNHSNIFSVMKFFNSSK